MTDKRHKDGDWGLPTDASGRIEKWEYVHIAVLMDIRDELKELNAVFRCPNFLEVPHLLREIRRNTRKPAKKMAGLK